MIIISPHLLDGAFVFLATIIMTQKPKLFVTGGSGYLGQHLLPIAAPHFELYAQYHRHANSIKAGQPCPLDIADREAVLRTITNIQPQAIIHAGAINPGQGDERAMMTMNGDGSGYIAEAAEAVGARLIHVSSDMVHDGRNAPYQDDALPTPLNGYGRSKAQGEARVRQMSSQAVIVRTSLIYGLEQIDRGTASFIKQLQTGQPLTLFSDVIRQPVWVNSLAEALLKLIENDYIGYINVAGTQAITREAFGRKLLAWWQVDEHAQIQAGRAADISDTIPLDVRLTLDKARELALPLPGVDEVLSRFEAAWQHP